MTAATVRLWWMITGTVGFGYGIAYAIIPGLSSRPGFVIGGAAVCGILFLVAIVVSIRYLLGRPARQ